MTHDEMLWTAAAVGSMLFLVVAWWLTNPRKKK